MAKRKMKYFSKFVIKISEKINCGETTIFTSFFILYVATQSQMDD